MYHQPKLVVAWEIYGDFRKREREVVYVVEAL